ncbi:hypothetical protein C1645_755905 [Glomus cerebriforme]|uniref:LsmAD domain-containing protein n=1 Tax=Glomus cerebriforme TaxID=658196 RepID=A0A397THX6_9GLOM|nr:hypothetical protein C1645_755905 [Glomus cerebriforme]
MHDRLMFLLVNFIGMNVTVTVRSGAKYQGLFKSASTKGELGVVLKMARKVLTKAEEKTEKTQNRVIPTYLIMAKDLMEIHACGIDFTTCDGDREAGAGSGFRTDTDISGRSEIRERELHKWTPDESGELMKGLEDDINSDSGNTSWDQFAANEQLFGIKTDFNEEIYTTKLDRSRADFKERERQAIAIANEITRSSTTNVHLLEERGFIVEESQMDEEERYGAVVRNRDPNKYTPPHLRKIQEQQQLQGGSVPVVKKLEPTKEPAKEVKIKSAEETKPTKQSQPSPTTTTATATATVTATATTITTSPATATTQKIPPFSSSSPLVNPVVSRKAGVDAEGKPIEDQIVKTFKQFATNEKERLQQRMQAIKKKDMDEKVDELRKWRQTFKLNLPLPQDLLPIMTKDKTKQQQLTAESATALNEKEKDKDSEKQKDKEKEKLEKEKEKEKQQEKDKDKDKTKDKPKERAIPTQNLEPKMKPEIKIEEDKSQKSNGDSTESKSANDKASDKPISAADKAPPQFPGRTAATTSNNSQFKLNAKANEWKPNPNAASFTPITPNTQDKRSPGSSPFFGTRQLRKNTATLKDGFTPFQKGKPVANPSSITPTWPFGNRPFRHQFTVTNNYEEDIYSQAAVTQGFGFAAYPVGHYRYPPNTQFVSVPPIPIQQGAPMPYMQPGQFVPGMPFTTAPMPPNGAPPMYSAQLPSVMPQHFGSQGYPSPGRTPMVPATMHPQMYQPYQNPHAMPPMMRFPHDMVPHVPPNGVMMGQRPVIMEQHYVNPEAAPMEGMPVSEPTTTQ